MKELKVGDRVKLRGYTWKGYNVDGLTGTITGIGLFNFPELVKVKLDRPPDGIDVVNQWGVLASQCIRLVKKEKETFFINEYAAPDGAKWPVDRFYTLQDCKNARSDGNSISLEVQVLKRHK